MANKVRIYDLAKELKLESKKVLDDARLMGVDVSVPSNSLDDVTAARIREKYYPKKEQATAIHKARLIKHPPASTVPAQAAETIVTGSSEMAETPVPVGPAPVVSDAPAASPAAETVTKVLVLKPIAEAAPPKVGEAPALPETPTSETTTTPGAVSAVSVPEVVSAGPAVVEPVSGTRTIQLINPQPAVQVAVQAPAQAPVQGPAQAKDLAEPGALATKDQSPPAVKAVEPPSETGARVAASTARPEPVRQPSSTTTIKLINVPVPAPVVPVAEAVSSAPATLAPAADLTPIPAGTPAAKPGRVEPPAVGTVVRKLTPPTRPMPMPSPTVSPRTKPTGKFERQPGQRDAAKEPNRDAQGKTVHILPSGAQQVKVYIPPKDQRPQGRHQKRKDQEGHQKHMPRKGGVVQHAAPAAPAVPVELKAVRLIEGSTIREFAEKIQAKPRDLVTRLMQLGVMASINQTINPGIAIELGKEYGWEVSFGDFEDMVVESEFEITPEAMEDNDLRAPIITVMGHVDHGKTSLLDAIRSARVAEGEAGGITQHIGAYSVHVPNPDNPAELRRVVFLDTPGHEAFTMMRARGARVTDIVVLVVAADDGVMPQTVEAIEHARAAGVPIIVAINKIDKPDANTERVKKELADRNLLWTGWSGNTEMVEVSARKQQNIDGLLEMILLSADIIELKANPKRRATGTVLEAKLDRGRGAMATVLVQNGTLHVGDPFIVGNYFGKVRALMNDRGERVDHVGPAMPVEVLGLEGVPSAGDQFQVVDDISKAQQISSYRQTHARSAALARSAARGLDQLRTQLEAGSVKELLVILKTDVQGSVEVLKDTLAKLSTDKVKVRIIRSGVGAITESDVLLASASQATESGAVTVIIGFNVRPETRAEEVARVESVDIRLHSIIYKVEEEIRNAMLGLMDATTREIIIGKAEVRDLIRVPKVGTVAGCMVINGYLKRTAHARLIRHNVVIFESHLGSLRRFKDDVSDVQQGYECGVTLERFNDYKIGDIVEAFLTEKVAPTQL
jgi:translation initiation factor IF-2